MKTCNRCNREYSALFFHKNPKSHGGRLNQCKNCVLKAHQNYRLLNLDKLKKRRKELYYRYRDDAIKRSIEWGRKNKDKRIIAKNKWRANNRELTNHLAKNYIFRRKGAKGSHTLSEYREKVELYKGICVYCKKAKANTKDHIIPLSKGGTNYIDNIVPACVSCNSSKRDKILMEWRPNLIVADLIL